MKLRAQARLMRAYQETCATHEKRRPWSLVNSRRLVAPVNMSAEEKKAATEYPEGFWNDAFGGFQHSELFLKAKSMLDRQERPLHGEGVYAFQMRRSWRSFARSAHEWIHSAESARVNQSGCLGRAYAVNKLRQYLREAQEELDDVAKDWPCSGFGVRKTSLDYIAANIHHRLFYLPLRTRLERWKLNKNRGVTFQWAISHNAETIKMQFESAQQERIRRVKHLQRDSPVHRAYYQEFIVAIGWPGSNI